MDRDKTDNLDLKKLEQKLDEALSNETSESLNGWLERKRMKNKQSMKRLLRIIVGFPLCLFPMFLATWIWLFTGKGETWVESVGYYTWCLASGDWDKLPD